MRDASWTETRLGPSRTMTDFPDVFAKNGGRVLGGIASGETNGSGAPRLHD